MVNIATLLPRIKKDPSPEYKQTIKLLAGAGFEIGNGSGEGNGENSGWEDGKSVDISVEFDLHFLGFGAGRGTITGRSDK